MFFRWLGKVSGTGVAEAGAICLGHVILAPSLAANAACRAPERIHVRQYESFGPFYLVLYHWWAWYLHRHGRHWYLDNPFEAEAFQLQHSQWTTEQFRKEW